MKSLYQKRGAEAFGHSIAGLLGRLPLEERKNEEERRKGFLDVAKELDKAYIAARYPNMHPKGPPFNVF